jgi:diguanylate cyclase (GGDEF)-like protein
MGRFDARVAAFTNPPLRGNARRYTREREACAEMLRILMFSANPGREEAVAEALRVSGLECICENAAQEDSFRRALAHLPDLVIVDNESTSMRPESALEVARTALPGTPCVRLASSDSTAKDTEADPETTASVDQIGEVVRMQLALAGIPTRRSSDQASETGMHEVSAVAQQLLERRSVLEEFVPPHERSTLASVLRRTPPSPVALVCIGDLAIRARYFKCLTTADITFEEVRDANTALARLDTKVHAVLFTDDLTLIGRVRKLYAGSATHIIFVSRDRSVTEKAALDAGANDWLEASAQGAPFWARLTAAHRIVSLAGSLQLALADNRILSTVDELTRSGSRRFFERQFPREVERAGRRVHPLALIMTDIDHFKRINDTYGHHVGDEVLREFVRRIFQGLRHREDWVARVGGEEFAIVLPEAGDTEAHAIAERLRVRISEEPMATSSGPLHVTASFGVCAHVPPRTGVSHSSRMVKAADSALYESKRQGRNRVTAGPCASGE